MSNQNDGTFFIVETLPDTRIRLIAPNGQVLFTVPPDIAQMIGEMLIEETKE